MNGPDCRKFGALWAIGQGLLTALVPQLGVKLFKRMLGQNFENADGLQAKPEYLRQLRAVGIGVAAAGVASLVMERVESGTEDTADPDASESGEKA